MKRILYEITNNQFVLNIVFIIVVTIMLILGGI